MTALLEFKQRLKGFFGKYEAYLKPVWKFLLSFVYFIWINQNMGYMEELNSIFIVLILSLICSILPSAVTVFAGFLLMTGHCYMLGLEVAVFMLLLIIFMLILFLRFSAGKNIMLVVSPLAFAFDLPALLPICGGLLGTAVSALPAGCGVIVFHFIRLLRSQSLVLQSPETDMLTKVTILADGLMQNWEMWLTVAAVVVAFLLVYLIRTRSFDYAWRIAIVAGGAAYVLVLFIGGFYLGVSVNVVSTALFAVIAVLIGMLLELFVFGGDYTRAERLEYEDDEYYYYVKAVPKASVATSERSIKKINADPIPEVNNEEAAETYANPIFHSDSSGEQRKMERKRMELKASEKNVKKIKSGNPEEFDFERKLEESLKDL